jgi:hypothetical protein
MALSPGGKHLLIELADRFVYATLSASKVARTRATECAARAMFSPDGNCIACLDAQGQVIVYRMDTGARRVIRGTTGKNLGFASRTHLYVADDHAIHRVSLVRPQQRKLASPHAPKGRLLVTPDGSRAVASYVDDGGQGDVLFTFRLDGKAARRKLGRDFEPRVFSADSQWLLMQRGRRGCVVRAVGGEYKCWNRFEAVDVTGNGRHILLAERVSPREVKLYRGALAGPKPRPPKQILTAASPAAAWLPPAP